MFEELDNIIINKHGKDADLSGCYGTIIINFRGFFITSNVGNIKSILIKKKIDLEEINQQKATVKKSVRSVMSGTSSKFMIDGILAYMSYIKHFQTYLSNFMQLTILALNFP